MARSVRRCGAALLRHGCQSRQPGNLLLAVVMRLAERGQGTPSHPTGLWASRWFGLTQGAHHRLIPGGGLYAPLHGFQRIDHRRVVAPPGLAPMQVKDRAG